jgi:hypothetical protein
MVSTLPDKCCIKVGHYQQVLLIAMYVLPFSCDHTINLPHSIVNNMSELHMNKKNIYKLHAKCETYDETYLEGVMSSCCIVTGTVFLLQIFNPLL